MRCRFCFATYDSIISPGSGHGLPLRDSLDLIGLVSAAGFRKITFAGGEPTMCPWLGDLIAHAKALGLKTGLVTNGSQLSLARWRDSLQDLDWLALSVDSLSAEVNIAHGRAVAGVRTIDPIVLIDVVRSLRSTAVRLKINTVVTRLNVDEILLPFIHRAKPERWKVMRILQIDGENDVGYKDLEISAKEFKRYLNQNAAVPAGTALVTEDNDDMTGSYIMIDPLGRFISNAAGRYEVSRPILDVGVTSALSEVFYDELKFKKRGGFYDW